MERQHPVAVCETRDATTATPRQRVPEPSGQQRREAKQARADQESGRSQRFALVRAPLLF